MKKHTKLLRSVIAVLLTFVLIGSAIPVVAFAADTADEVIEDLDEHLTTIERMIVSLFSSNVATPIALF